ncbi:MAG: DUF4838 domain-containing protein [Clostridiales bacterium]|nr:DUF4838 domain-containing protein [Clostridiales bacterium]
MNVGLTILYEDLCTEWVTLCREAGIDSLCVHKLARPGEDSLSVLLGELDAPHGRDVIEALAENGIDAPYELHALDHLLPRPLFAGHPDWFRMNGEGRRTPDMNLCASSGEALDALAENTYALAKKLRQPSSRYHLWLDDANGGSCGCPECSKMNSSDQYIRILSAMLKGLRAYDPKAEISFLSYGTVLDVPTVKPEEGIFLEFAPMDRDHDKAMDAPDHPRGARYIALMGELLKIFDPKSSEVLEYWLDDALYSGYRRPPVKVPFNEAVCEADCAMYRGAGFGCVRSFGSFMGKDYFELFGEPPVRRYAELARG